MKRQRPDNTAPERHRKMRAKRREIGSKPREALAPRGDFEKPAPGDDEGWLRTYLPEAFFLPFGQVHRDIIAAFRAAMRTGGHLAIAAPRGTGKSALVNGLTLKALLEGEVAFPVVIPWDDRAKRRAFRLWSAALCFNARIHRDYPEASRPFRESRGSPNKLAALTMDGEPTGARLGISEGIIILPHGLGAIGSATINGNPRGLYYASIDGRIIRPSMVAIDDPQDRKTAHSPTRVADTIGRVDSDVGGMAGPDSRMPMVMTCTVTFRDDVAEHYLSHPDWRAVRVGQIATWPDGWEEKGSEARRLWKEWNDARQAAEDPAEAVKFYVEHKAAMTAGMAVSWDARYDARRGQPDALYAAILDYHVMGPEAFAAERQNAPLVQGVTLYNLTPDVICSRAVERKPGEVPGWVRMRIAATDINPSYGLTWALTGFGPDQTAAVLGYGVHPMHVSYEATPAELAAGIYEALVAHGKKLAALPCKPEAWVIDAGGAAFDAVNKFARNSVAACGLPAIPATGRPAQYYTPYGRTVLGRPREGCHMAHNERGWKWIAYNSCYWREQQQKGWTGSIGAPGSCSLPAGHHREFAEQVCREQLAGKAEMGGKMRWEWHKAPGKNDYCDAMTMCYMAAAFAGIGTGGAGAPIRQRRRQPGGVTAIPI